MDAIVFTSNTGFTAQYAEMLGQATGLPVYDLNGNEAPQGAEIIYLGWLSASAIKGYKKAARRYKIRSVGAVCMAESGSQIAEVRQRNNIPELPLFTMQGGFAPDKLQGMNKFMMSIMGKFVVKGLSEKTDRTPQEDDMLEMWRHGGNHVSAEHLQPLLDWYEQSGR